MNELTDWLLEGDPAIRWQTMRDLLAAPAAEWQMEREQVASIGWAARLLSLQDPQGTWGGGLYSPKWTSTTYTLLQLRDMGLSTSHPAAQRATRLLIDEYLGPTGTPRFSDHLAHMDLCVVGMFLGLAVYFEINDPRIEAMLSHLLQNQMADGGWNCRSLKRGGAIHSSFHTTFNVLEGLQVYLESGSAPFSAAIKAAQARAVELMLQHHMFRSDKTGEIIEEKFLYFSYPYRWYYDVLRGLDFFQRIRTARDARLVEAIELVKSKQRKDGSWPVQNRHPGKSFFEMEQMGKPSRWNTLRALRIIRWWE
jgi:hypothetical protein